MIRQRTVKRTEKDLSEAIEQDVLMYNDSQENLLGVFSILLTVAKRTNPEKYLNGYKSKL